MKKHSRILLLALAGAAIATTGLPLSLVVQLSIGETPASRRSLIYYLARTGDVWLERHQAVLHVGLTAQGRRRLERQFPALLLRRPAATVWQLLLLKQAPKSDPHFRSLAVLCTKYRVLHLTRGVYAYPGDLPVALETQLQALYADEHLARCTVQDWVAGLDRPIIVSHYDIEPLSAIYSSISNELGQLLSSDLSNKASMYRTISSICSVIDRLESALSSDCGLVQHFFPKTPSAADLVNGAGEVLTTIEQPE